MTKISHGWVGTDVEARISAHVQAWEKIRPLGKHQQLETYPFVSISREFGCEALPLAQRLTEVLNERCRPSIPWVAYDRELLDKVADELHLRRDILDSLDGRRLDTMSELFDNIINRKVADAVVVRKLAEVIRSLAVHGHAVLVGRGSSFVTQDLKNGLHVRLVAPRAWRIARIAADRNIPGHDAEKIVDEGEKQRHNYITTYFVFDPHSPFPHDLVVDNSRFNLVQLGEIVFSALAARFGETLVGA
ncbi:MAG TPA: cytidylate kinase-like family protein [Verrucomicrobiae bacterium]|nr:cytidylate kinase-like family protein [Verrucomicrobiae bacterium]